MVDISVILYSWPYNMVLIDFVLANTIYLPCAISKLLLYLLHINVNSTFHSFIFHRKSFVGNLHEICYERIKYIYKLTIVLEFYLGRSLVFFDGLFSCCNPTLFYHNFGCILDKQSTTWLDQYFLQSCSVLPWQHMLSTSLTFAFQGCDVRSWLYRVLICIVEVNWFV